MSSRKNYKKICCNNEQKIICLKGPTGPPGPPGPACKTCKTECKTACKTACKTFCPSEEQFDSCQEKNVKYSLQQKYNGMKCELSRLRQKYKDNIVILMQSDFSCGTYVISQPGVYHLGENITFNPNSRAKLRIQQSNPSLSFYESGDVQPFQFPQYHPAAFGIGFFAAIAITAKNVVLDLQGYTLRQSAEHALAQRFYANIELASQPFIPVQGPHSFGFDFKAAENCFIVNGTLGLSSHNGIHGNSNKRIFMRDLHFVNYEVSAASLNNVNGWYVSNCYAAGSRKDLPIVGTFSGARFIRPYINKLVADGFTGTINGQNATLIKSRLKTANNNVFYDVIETGNKFINKNTHLEEWKVFDNKHRVIDGNAYGFTSGALGVIVNGFPKNRKTSSCNIYFNKVKVANNTGWNNEIPVLKGESGRQKGPVGAVLQTHNTDPDGNFVTINNSKQYTGNIAADAQLLVAKAVHAGFNFGFLSVTRMTITKDTVKWAEGQLTWPQLMDSTKGIACNGDSMFHVGKGQIGFKMDSAETVVLQDCGVYDLKNIGEIGSTLCSDNTSIGASGDYRNFDYENGIGLSNGEASYNGYGGASVRAFSFSSSKDVVVCKCEAIGVSSVAGSAYGMDIHWTALCVKVCSFEAQNICASIDTSLGEYNKNPTALPVAYGIHIGGDSKKIDIVEYTVGGLKSPGMKFKKLTEEF